MKPALKRLMTAAAVVALSTGLSFAQNKSTAPEVKAPAADGKFEKAKEYHAQCTGATSEEFAKIQAQLMAFTDAEVMAETLNDPEKFAALTVAVNDPHAIHVMASCAMEPVMWSTWIQNGTDFKKMASAMTKLMNPAGMMKWAMAPMNPKLWSAAGAHMDADRYVKWGSAVASPAFYAPVTAMTEAKWYEQRLKWAADSKTYTPFVQMFASFMPTTATPAPAPAAPAPVSPRPTR